MEPVDLSVHPPRSPYVKLGGLYMLARTIDKVRAEQSGGNIADYHFSGFSQTLVDALGISADDLRAVINESKSEDRIVAWVLANAKTDNFEEINATLLSRVLTDENRERLTAKYPVIREHPDVERLFDVLDLDDKIAAAR